MVKLTTIPGGTSVSPSISSAQRNENTPLQETTNKERAIRRFEDELKKLKEQGGSSKNEFVASSSMSPSQKLPAASDQLSENEQYAKALLIAVREEIYKKGYKSANKLRPCPPGKDTLQWEEEDKERRSQANAELLRVRATGGKSFFDLLRIQNSIEGKGHNCGDLSYSGIGILDEVGIKDTHMVMFDKSEHAVILIGKLPSTGLSLNMQEWPSHLAICDSWGNVACSAKEFIPTYIKKMQKWLEEGKEVYDSYKQAWTPAFYPDLEKELNDRKTIKAFNRKFALEFKDKEGNTPLISAARAGKVGDMQVLVKAGANIEAKDSDGRTALMIAAQEGNVEVLEALLRAGADIEAKDNYGATALMIAAQEGKVEALEALLRAGADKEPKNDDGVTALMLATYSGEGKAVEALLSAGDDPNAKDNEGVTALMLAAGQDNVEALEALLRAGADKEAKNNTGYTALMCAAYSGAVETLKALLRAGADKDAKDNDGNTALMLAIEQDNVEVLEILRQDDANKA